MQQGVAIDFCLSCDTTHHQLTAMKSLLWALLLTVPIITSSNAQKPPKKLLQERHIHDTYVEEITFLNKRRNVATVRTFTHGGERLTEEHYANYREGIKHGLTRCWHPNGKIYWSSDFKHGVTHGPLLVYYPDGSLKRREYFKNGVSRKRECFDHTGEAQSCQAFSRPASFAGTVKEFQTSVRQKLEAVGYIPDNTAHVIGFQGVIEDNGQITQLMTLYTSPETDILNREFTDKVRQALMQIPRWQSAIVDDRPISSAYVLSLLLVKKEVYLNNLLGKEVYLNNMVEQELHRKH